MRPDSSSPFWPTAAAGAAVVFTAISLALVLDVRALQAEHQRTVATITVLHEVDAALEELPATLNADRLAAKGLTPSEAFHALVVRVHAALDDLERRDLFGVDVDRWIAQARADLADLRVVHARQVELLAKYERSTEEERKELKPHEASNAFLDIADVCNARIHDLVRDARAHASDLSHRLARRWSVSHAILLVSCAIAGMSAYLLRRNQRSVGDLRRTQQALHETEARLGTIVANTPIIVWAVDAAGTLTLAEGAALAHIGVLPGERVGASIQTIYADNPVVLDAHRRALAGESVDYRSEIKGVQFQSLLIPFRGPDGAVTGAMGIATDVTARERAKAELRRAELQRFEAQKAEAVHRVAGGVAHEFSNLLTVITGFAALLKTSPDILPQHVEDVGQILKAAGRAAELTQQLLAFSRRQRSEPRVVDLNVVVADARKVLGTILGGHVEVRVLPAPAPLAVRLDVGQFQQVLLNLALNARDAMPDGGSFLLDLAEARREVMPEEILLDEGRYARLRVTDTGLGMDEATQKRVFEPFFTTKGPQRGTGLGLPTVQGILRQAGGDVAFQSAPGHGTTFQLFLPLAVDAEIEVDADTKELVLPRGRETILLAEDEAMVRAFTSRVLRRAGYEVLEAQDGKSALEVARRYRGRIDLLVSDVVMPVIGGRELAAKLQEVRPGTPVLFLSAYVHEDSTLEYIQKPFTPQDLCRLVRARLDADLWTHPRPGTQLGGADRSA